MAYTWRSAANVEEFLRLRDTVTEFSRTYPLRSGHVSENLRDLARMRAIARDELSIARRDLWLVRGCSFLDLALRLDMDTQSTEAILNAKIRQVEELLATGLPGLEKRVKDW